METELPDTFLSSEESIVIVNTRTPLSLPLLLLLLGGSKLYISLSRQLWRAVLSMMHDVISYHLLSLTVSKELKTWIVLMTD